MTLLQKAFAASFYCKPNYRRGAPMVGRFRRDERAELALAWLSGEVGISQVAHAMGIERGRNQCIYTFLAGGIKDAFNDGELRLRREEPEAHQ